MTAAQKLYDDFLDLHHPRRPPPPPPPPPPPNLYNSLAQGRPQHTMLFDDGDASLLKKWIVKRLEDISDADSDVLADYVLALLRHEQAEDEVKRLCIEQLDDFLQEHTNRFVDDVFTALQTKAFLSVNSTLTGGGLSVVMPDAPVKSEEPTSSSSPTQARKRPYFDRDALGAEPADDGRGKQARRGRGGPGGFGTPPVPPAPPAGFPAIPWMPPADSADPMAAFLAAQAAAAAWAGASFPGGKEGEKKVVKKVGERCKDYDEKGFCMKGDMCPYEHGVDHIVVPGQEGKDEYDPNNSMLFPPATSNDRNSRPSRGRGGHNPRGRGGSVPRRGGRSDFSTMGPSHDRSNTTLVVENIPPEQLNVPSITTFFTTFGPVTSVEPLPQKSLAIVHFATHDAAKSAYDSPAPIFDNRFVKVFWHRPTHNAEPAATTPPPSSPPLDIAAITAHQEQLQKVYEEKQLKQRAVAAAAAALKLKSENLARAQAEEKRKLLEKLAARSKKTTPAGTAHSTPAPMSEAERKKEETTAALKAQLEALQKEADALGIPEAPAEDTWDLDAFRGRGRGGRGRFVARGYTQSRGRGRGRGGAATMKLDNRTRRVIVHAPEWEGDKDEEFRHYLINNGIEVEAIAPGDNTLVVTFKDRRNAERFVYAGNDIPGVGAVSMKWDNTAPPIMAKREVQDEDEDMEDAQQVGMGNGNGNGGRGRSNGEEEEYDTAEIDERWEDAVL